MQPALTKDAVLTALAHAADTILTLRQTVSESSHGALADGADALLGSLLTRNATDRNQNKINRRGFWCGIHDNDDGVIYYKCQQKSLSIWHECSDFFLMAVRIGVSWPPPVVLPNWRHFFEFRIEFLPSAEWCHADHASGRWDCFYRECCKSWDDSHQMLWQWQQPESEHPDDGADQWSELPFPTKLGAANATTTTAILGGSSMFLGQTTGLNHDLLAESIKAVSSILQGNGQVGNERVGFGIRVHVILVFCVGSLSSVWKLFQIVLVLATTCPR